MGPKTFFSPPCVRKRQVKAAHALRGVLRAVVRPGGSAGFADQCGQAQPFERRGIAGLERTGLAPQTADVGVCDRLQSAVAGVSALGDRLQQHGARLGHLAQRGLHLRQVDACGQHAGAAGGRLVGRHRLLVVRQRSVDVVNLHLEQADVGVDLADRGQVASGPGQRQALQGVRHGLAVFPQAHQAHVHQAVDSGRICGRTTSDAGQALQPQVNCLSKPRLQNQAPDPVEGHLQAQHIVADVLAQRLHRVERLDMRVGLALAPVDIRPHPVQAQAAAQIAAVVKRQGAVGMAQRHQVSLALRRVFGGTQPVDDGLTGAASTFKMLGNLTGEFGFAPLGLVLQPACGARVGQAPIRLQHGVVSHLVQQVVAKSVFVRAGERAVRLQQRELAAVQAGKLLSRPGVERGQGVVPEACAHHAGLLQAAQFAPIQRVERGLQHAHQRTGHFVAEQRLGLHLPVPVHRAGSAGVDQHLQQRLHVIRVAVGLLRQKGTERGVRLRKAAEQSVSQGLGTVRRQRRDPYALVRRPVLGPPRAPLQQGRACGAQQQQRQR